MAYVWETPIMGMPAVTFHGTYAPGNPQRTPPWKLGDVAKAVDPTYGVGEFIFLLGVASTAVGSVVTYSLTTWATTLAAVGSNLPRPIAFAMSACVAGEYGWYQIGGYVIAKKTSTISLAANVAVGIKTTGLIASTGSGKEIQGALVAVAVTAASALTTVALIVNRPHLQGRVT